MLKIKRLYSSIVLLILGILIAKTQLIIGDGCIGVANGLSAILLGGIYFVVFIIVNWISFVKYYNDKVKFNYYPLIATLITILLIYVAINIEKIESKTVIYSELLPNAGANFNLYLRENNSFKIERHEYHWTCYYKGKYKIDNDTLRLLRKDIQNVTDNFIFRSYIINHNNKRMYPINELDKIDSTKKLYIMYEL